MKKPVGIKGHQYISRVKCEEMLELNGIKYISNPRCGKRGEGAAIAVNLRNYTLSKLNVHIPKGVETVWGLVRPKTAGKVSKIITCSFYSPPDKQRNVELINHLMNTLQSLINIHPSASIIICGDRNKIEIQSLLCIEPSLKQIVTRPTYGRKILDVICTSLAHLYCSPTILPPLKPDMPDAAAPSDHRGVQAAPLRVSSSENIKTVRNVRPLPDSAVFSFRQKFEAINFYTELDNLPVDEMVSKFQNISSSLFTASFPEKRIVCYSDDKPWYNVQLRQLKRQLMREYAMKGKSQIYVQLHENYTSKIKEAINNYKEKMKQEVLEGKRGSIYPIVKKLGSRPHTSDKTFLLPSHAALKLSYQQ